MSADFNNTISLDNKRRGLNSNNKNSNNATNHPFSRWDSQKISRDDHEMENKIHNIKSSKNQSWEFDNFKDKIRHFKNGSENFKSVWSDGLKLLRSKMDKQYIDQAGAILLRLLDSYPQYYDKYENDIQLIFKYISPIVRVWYFFYNSDYYFKCLSNENSLEVVTKFNWLIEEGNRILNDINVNTSSKSDVAERLLLVIDVSDPNIVRSSITDLSSYIIKNNYFQRLEDHGFLFNSRNFNLDININKSNYSDDPKIICNKWIIKNSVESQILRRFNKSLIFVILILFASLVIYLL